MKKHDLFNFIINYKIRYVRAGVKTKLHHNLRRFRTSSRSLPRPCFDTGAVQMVDHELGPIY